MLVPQLSFSVLMYFTIPVVCECAIGSPHTGFDQFFGGSVTAAQNQRPVKKLNSLLSCLPGSG
jgi:hypothetical protein